MRQPRDNYFNHDKYPVWGVLKQFSNYIKQIPFFLPNISKKKGICKYFGEDMDYLTDIISRALSEYSFMTLALSASCLRSSSFKTGVTTL